jgi:hypothetical protein
MMPQGNNTLPSAESGKELPLHLQHWEPWLQSVLLEYPDLSEQDRHDITHRIADFVKWPPCEHRYELRKRIHEDDSIHFVRECVLCFKPTNAIAQATLTAEEMASAPLVASQEKRQELWERQWAASQSVKMQMLQVLGALARQSRFGIKPIETRYNGYRFRSRLEARWGIFLDTAGIAWEYEPQGFELPSGRYLPDFWIHSVDRSCYTEGTPSEVGFWLEIKGSSPAQRDLDRCGDLSRLSRHCVYLACGDPLSHATWKWHPAHQNLAAFEPAGFQHQYRQWTLLEHYLAVTARPLTKRGNYDFDFSKAGMAARSARFEHGECG